MTDKTPATTLLHDLSTARKRTVDAAVAPYPDRKAARAAQRPLALTISTEGLADTPANRVALLSSALGECLADVVTLSLMSGGNAFDAYNSATRQANDIVCRKATECLGELGDRVLLAKFKADFLREGERQQKERELRGRTS